MSNKDTQFKKGESGNPSSKFKKGQSGNPRGRPPKIKHIPDILEKIGHEPLKGDSEETKLDAIMRKVYKEAFNGKSWAVQFIAERTEGKVKDVVTTESEVTFVMANMPLPEHSEQEVIDVTPDSDSV